MIETFSCFFNEDSDKISREILMMNGELKVSFVPDGISVFVLPGTSLLEAVGRAGIVIDSPCGGQGKCGKCRVEFEDGAPEPTPAECGILKHDEIEKGVRLACQAAIQRESVIKIPESSRLSTQNILTSGTEERKEIKPSLWKVYMPLGKPGLGDELSDIDRIRQKANQFSIGIYLIRELPQLLRKSDFKVTCVFSDGELISIEPGDTTKENFGLAFDIGTTTVVGTLLNLSTGEDLAVTSRLNPQVIYGDDVISRIRFAMGDNSNLDKLHYRIIETINEMVTELVNSAGISKQNIYKMVVVGNTCMQHLFCRIDPASLGAIPFTPVVREPLTIKAKKVGVEISSDGTIYVFPCIGGFVGGDTVSVVLATGMKKSSKIKLAIDIGTNGEIVLGNRERLISASTAAGPAFEGARISRGMRASPGAIEKVIINEDIHINVIGNTAPSGICGSGLIDAVAQLVASGIIDSSGKILPREELKGKISSFLVDRIVKVDGQNAFLLVDEEHAHGGRAISITQRDVREFQLAKAAISAGVKLLKKELGVSDNDIEEVVLAGALGNFIRRSNAKKIGLIPDVPSEKIRFIGNAASSGAKLSLLSGDLEKETDAISGFVQHIELSSRKDFLEEFTNAMFFPE